MPSDNDRLLMMSKGKIVGCGCLIIVIYLVLFFMCRSQSPESYVMEMIPPVVVVLLLVWKESAWMKGLVVVLFPMVGYYVLCYNNIPGPLEAYNMDKPVNVLSHFHDSWRYYWVMEYLDRVVWRWGIISVVIIVICKACLKVKQRWSSGEHLMLFLILVSALFLGCNNVNKRIDNGLNSHEDTVEFVATTDSFVKAVNQRELYERKKTELHNQMISCCSNKQEKELVNIEWTAYENVEKQMMKIASNLGHLLCWGGVSGPACVTNSMYSQIVEARIDMYMSLVEVKSDSIPDINGAYYAPTEKFFLDCMDSTLAKAEMVMVDDDETDTRFIDDEDRRHFIETLEETKNAVMELKALILIWKDALLRLEFFVSHIPYENYVERLASQMLIRWACAASD